MLHRQNKHPKEHSEEKPKVKNYLYQFRKHNSLKKINQNFKNLSSSKKNSSNQLRTLDPSPNTSASVASKPPLKDYLKESRMKRLNKVKVKLDNEYSK